MGAHLFADIFLDHYDAPWLEPLVAAAEQLQHILCKAGRGGSGQVGGSRGKGLSGRGDVKSMKSACTWGHQQTEYKLDHPNSLLRPCSAPCA